MNESLLNINSIVRKLIANYCVYICRFLCLLFEMLYFYHAFLPLSCLYQRLNKWVNSCFVLCCCKERSSCHVLSDSDGNNNCTWSTSGRLIENKGSGCFWGLGLMSSVVLVFSTVLLLSAHKPGNSHFKVQLQNGWKTWRFSPLMRWRQIVACLCQNDPNVSKLHITTKHVQSLAQSHETINTNVSINKYI